MQMKLYVIRYLHIAPSKNAELWMKCGKSDFRGMAVKDFTEYRPPNAYLNPITISCKMIHPPGVFFLFCCIITCMGVRAGGREVRRRRSNLV